MATTTLSNAFISLNDIINNFLISYTGPGKLIPDAIRTEVIFHARRCLQEFAYETLKSQFTEGPTAVTALTPIDLPQDFVAVISAENSGSGTNPLTEVSTPPIGAGEFYINYINKTITYGDTGNATLTYLSNALTTDESAAIPKLAEAALYSCMVYSILSNREKTRPDVLQRLLMEKTERLEKAKSRLVFTNFD
tara:strand:+ start:8221 stop:8802 length:582 start_codon:yes stop_codon:yes gene_type:complete